MEVIVHAVATGLSMIPASLVVVLTTTMAADKKHLMQRSVIVRNLKSLEALGAVTDTCSNNTDTLTQGKMVARKAWMPALGTCTVDTSSEPFKSTIREMFFDACEPQNLDGAKPDGRDEAHGPEDKCAREAAQLLAADKQTALVDYLSVASLLTSPLSPREAMNITPEGIRPILPSRCSAAASTGTGST